MPDLAKSGTERAKKLGTWFSVAGIFTFLALFLLIFMAPVGGFERVSTTAIVTGALFTFSAYASSYFFRRGFGPPTSGRNRPPHARIVGTVVVFLFLIHL